MTASMMYKTLQAMFPRNYDIPIELHIKYAIQSNNGKQKRLKARQAQNEVQIESAQTGHDNEGIQARSCEGTEDKSASSNERSERTKGTTSTAERIQRPSQTNAQMTAPIGMDTTFG